MTLWTKETITGDLRDLPAGMQEIRTPEGELCRDCSEHPHIFTAGRGIFLYGKAAHHSLTRYKEGSRREYQRFYIRAAV